MTTVTRHREEIVGETRGGRLESWGPCRKKRGNSFPGEIPQDFMIKEREGGERGKRRSGEEGNKPA
jgi:hypothetical protein